MSAEEMVTNDRAEASVTPEPSPYARKVRLYSWLIYVVARLIFFDDANASGKLRKNCTWRDWRSR